MYLKDFEGTLINLDTMLGGTVQKINNKYVLIVLRGDPNTKDIGICQSDLRSKIEQVYGYVEECIKTREPIIDVKKYILHNALFGVEAY